MSLAATGESTVLTALLAGRYVSLHTGDPGTTGANEVSGGSYARQAATFTQSGSNPTVASNNGTIQYPTATAAWGTVTHFGLWTAASGGNYLGGGAVTTPKSIDTDDIARWEATKLSVTAN